MKTYLGMHNNTLTQTFNRKGLLHVLLFAFVLLINNRMLLSQKAFDVNKLSFCSSINDEFSPVFYKDGLVYCSNIFNNAAFSLESDEQKLFNIIYVRDKDTMNWGNPELFAKELTTILNEGPATFENSNNTIYFARNILVEGKLKEINVPSNRQGIYSARIKDGLWSDIEAFPYNNQEYNLGTPSITTDGSRIYFASDMLGGYGGTDIYFCDYKDGKWTTPKNLGPNINTSFDESYPYAGLEGQLFFSSNGHPGLGGKDIFYCVWRDNDWSNPIHLKGEINSPANDFGFITDPNFQYGYFSSDRNGSLDIFSFSTRTQQFGICDTIQEISQCFTFYDERFTDTLHLELEWDFGFGITQKGVEVQHCFSKPGKYQVLLTITHYIADSTYKKYAIHEFEIEPVNQPWFYLPDYILNGNTIELNAEKTKLDNINKPVYYWDFGEGFTSKGLAVEHIFNEPGEYYVALGAIGAPNEEGINKRQCIQQTVRVVSDIQSLAQNIAASDNKIYKLYAPSEKEIEIETPKDEDDFRIVNFQMLKNNILTEKQITHKLDSLKQNYIRFLNNNIQYSDRNIIDIYITVLKQYPALKLEIAIHTSDKGSAKANLETTNLIAGSISKYMLENSVDLKRFTADGYGDTRPLIDNKNKSQRQINQRIEFILFQE